MAEETKNSNTPAQHEPLPSPGQRQVPANITLADRIVTTVTPRDTTEISLRLMDWKRIYHNVKGICPCIAKRELFSGLCWGITASAIFAFVALAASPPSEPIAGWIKPSLIIGGIASLIIGIVIYCAGQNEVKNVESLKAEILRDMKAIHSVYFSEDDIDKG